MVPVPAIYRGLGVRPVIHGCGTATRYGGSRLRPDALETIREASTDLVNIDELNASLGWNGAKSLVSDRTAPNYRDPSNLFQPEWNISAGAAESRSGAPSSITGPRCSLAGFSAGAAEVSSCDFSRLCVVPSSTSSPQPRQ